MCAQDEGKNYSREMELKQWTYLMFFKKMYHFFKKFQQSKPAHISTTGYHMHNKGYHPTPFPFLSSLCNVCHKKHRLSITLDTLFRGGKWSDTVTTVVEIMQEWIPSLFQQRKFAPPVVLHKQLLFMKPDFITSRRNVIFLWTCWNGPQYNSPMWL